MENSVRSKNHKALCVAMANNHLEATIAALQSGADPNYANYSHPPIFNALLLGTPNILEALIAFGVNVNYALRNGMTPLHGAVLLRTNDCADLLLNAGANPNARNQDGDTPLDILLSPTRPRRDGHATLDLIERLIAKGAVPSRKNLRAISRLKAQTQAA